MAGSQLLGKTNICTIFSMLSTKSTFLHVNCQYFSCLTILNNKAFQACMTLIVCACVFVSVCVCQCICESSTYQNYHPRFRAHVRACGQVHMQPATCHVCSPPTQVIIYILTIVIIIFTFWYLPRCMECRRSLAMRILSVCPSVRHTRGL